MKHPIPRGGAPAPRTSRIRELLPPGFAGTFAFFLLILSAGLVLLVLAFWIAVRMTPEGVRSRAIALDHALMLWFRSRGTGTLDRAAVEVTFVGARLTGWVLLLAVTSFLWMMRERIEVLFLWTSFLGSILLSVLLKSLVGRARPDPEFWRIAGVTDGSFPSGHAINAVVVFGGLFWVIHRMRPPPALGGAALVLAVIAILLIGLSRPYLGVHYPLDVVAGYLAGAGWLAVSAVVTGAVSEPALKNGCRYPSAGDAGASSLRGPWHEVHVASGCRREPAPPDHAPRNRQMPERDRGAPAPETLTTVTGEDWYGRDISGQAHANVLFVNLDLTEVENRGATFTECTFRGVRFNVSEHRDAAFVNCSFEGCSLYGARFIDCKLVGSRFDRCTTEGLEVAGGDWSFVALRGADLESVSFRGTRMRDADLAGARCQGSSMRDVDLSGAWLHNADFSACDLRGSDLSAFDPEHVKLRDAIITIDQTITVAEALGLDVRTE